MARDYDPSGDYAEDDQLLAEESARRAAEEAADLAAWERDLAAEDFGDWPTSEEIAEYERRRSGP
jgi:hypothetical protein